MQSKQQMHQMSVPFPPPETEYCINKNSVDVTHVAELVIGLDQIKQILA